MQLPSETVAHSLPFVTGAITSVLFTNEEANEEMGPQLDFLISLVIPAT